MNKISSVERPTWEFCLFNNKWQVLQFNLKNWQILTSFHYNFRNLPQTNKNDKQNNNYKIVFLGHIVVSNLFLLSRKILNNP